ncbi:MAG: hypothetical protein GY861_23415 [bacterium]|nr:hypothetical protein [bacterium]
MEFFDTLVNTKLGVLVFYVILFSLVFIFRKKFEIQAKIIALYKTKFGLKLMDKISSKFREPIKLFGYIGIGVGYIGMFFIAYMLLNGLITLFFQPSAPPTISPVIPGFKIPGTDFELPLIQTLLAIFVVAVIHEFSHGVVARAHKIKVKSSGPALFLIFFAAFVEIDENELKKRSDVTQYSVFAAGPFANIIFAVLILFVTSLIFTPVFNSLTEPEGISFTSFREGFPAEASGLEVDVVYNQFNDEEFNNSDEFINLLYASEVDDTIKLGNSANYTYVTTTTRPDDPYSMPFIGVESVENHYVDEDGIKFTVLKWVNGFLVLLFILSLGIGLANLMPLGPFDGGRMFLLSSCRISGEQRGKSIWMKISFLFLAIIIIMLVWPLVRGFFGF